MAMPQHIDKDAIESRTPQYTTAADYFGGMGVEPISKIDIMEHLRGVFSHIDM